MSTLLQMKTEVEAHGFADSAYGTRIVAWLNEGQARIGRRLELRELYKTQTINLSAGTATYSLPADFVRLDALTDTVNGFALRSRLPGEIDSYRTISGWPTYYDLDAGGLNLYPTPSGTGTLRLRYYANPAALSADGDVSVLPSDYHDVMVSYALTRAYEAEDDFQAAQYWDQRYQRGLMELGSDRQFENRDGPEQLAGTWGERRNLW